MSSERTPGGARLRRFGPWGLYGLAALAAVPLYRATIGSGSSPAEAEVRRVTLSGPRTSHRLRVEEVRVAPGDAVTAGQVLARMESAELDAALAAARHRLEELELEVAAVAIERRGDRTQSTNQLARQAEQARVELARLAAEEEQDRSELAELEVAIRREEALVADRIASAERLGELKLRRAGLTARLAQLRGAVEEARRGAASSSARLAAWSETRGDAPTPAGSVDDEVAPARAAAAEQRELVRELEATVARLEIRAPFAGRVEQILLRPGETAGTDCAVLTVVDDRPGRAVVWVDHLRATRVRLGDQARLVPRDGSGPALQGRVVALAPAVSEIPIRFAPIPRWGRAVYVALDAPAALPGQAFDATFWPASGGAP